MKSKVSIAVIFVASLLAFPGAAAADDWGRVSRLASGTILIVSVRGAEPVRGPFASADAAGLDVLLDGVSPLRAVRRFERQTISSITTAAVESNPIGCAFAGYFGGAFVGGMPGALVGGAVNRDTGGALIGMVAGWSLRGVHVYRRCRHKPERVIYRAPEPIIPPL